MTDDTCDVRRCEKPWHTEVDFGGLVGDEEMTDDHAIIGMLLCRKHAAQLLETVRMIRNGILEEE